MVSCNLDFLAFSMMSQPGHVCLIEGSHNRSHLGSWSKRLQGFTMDDVGWLG